MSARRIVVTVMLTLFALLLVSVRPAWAVTITPNPPIAGQPITFSGSSADVGGPIYSGFGCTGSAVAFVSTGGPGPYSFTLTSGLPAGSYSVSIVDDITPPTGCVDFTVIAQSAPSPVGGLIESADTLAILGPWFVVIIIVGCMTIVVVLAKKPRL